MCRDNKFADLEDLQKLMYYSVGSGKYELVYVLSKLGVDVNYTLGVVSCLRLASTKQDLPMVQLLVALGANVDKSDVEYVAGVYFIQNSVMNSNNSDCIKNTQSVFGILTFLKNMQADVSSLNDTHSSFRNKMSSSSNKTYELFIKLLDELPPEQVFFDLSVYEKGYLSFIQNFDIGVNKVPLVLYKKLYDLAHSSSNSNITSDPLNFCEYGVNYLSYEMDEVSASGVIDSDIE